jgi:uncharacterized membrane protein YhaH (DUF805 family)
MTSARLTKRSLTHCWSRLADFSGRDPRELFWPFAIINLAGTYVAVIILFAVILSTDFEAIEAYAAANPDKATTSSGALFSSVRVTDPPPGLMPDIGDFALPMLAIGLVFIALHSAAVARRLHDLGQPGWIGAIPALLFCLAFAAMFQLILTTDRPADHDSGLFFGGLAVTMLYNLSLVGLGVFLARKGSAQPNRYGERHQADE